MPVIPYSQAPAAGGPKKGSDTSALAFALAFDASADGWTLLVPMLDSPRGPLAAPAVSSQRSCYFYPFSAAAVPPSNAPPAHALIAGWWTTQVLAAKACVAKVPGASAALLELGATDSLLDLTDKGS